MLRWAALFLVIALVAGLLGFAGIVGAASSIAWIISALFLFLFVASLFVMLLFLDERMPDVNRQSTGKLWTPATNKGGR